MAQLAYDGASPFSLTAAKAHSGIIVTGYLVGHPGGFEPIDRARVAKIRALGMGFLPNWERGASQLVTCGQIGGLAAGKEAVLALRDLAVPDDGTVACAFSWDTNISPWHYPSCGKVADGIIEGLAGRYRFTAYGQGGLIDYLAKTGRLQSKGWLSGSASFPGFNVHSPNIAMVQSHDATGHWLNSQVPGTDVNTVLDPLGVHAWWPDASPFREFSMTPADEAAIAKMIDTRADQTDAKLAAALAAIPVEVWAHIVALQAGPKGNSNTAAKILSNIHYVVHELLPPPAKP